MSKKKLVDPSAWVRGRDRVKATMAKCEKFGNEISDHTTIEAIEIRLTKIDEVVESFIRYDDALGELEGYEYEYDEFEDRVAVVKEKLLKQRNKLRSLDKSQEVSNSNGDQKPEHSDLVSALQTFTNGQRTSYESMLPKIHIKSFTGQYRDWPTFHDQFSKIHTDKRLNGIQRLTYLRALLQPEPLLLIENLLITNENYDVAWSKLTKRYGNNRKIVTSYVDTFMNQHQIKYGNAAEIGILSDNVDNILSGLDSIDKSKCRDVWLVHILLDKLDHDTRRLWAEYTTKTYENNADPNKIFPTIEEFVNFLDQRRIILEATSSQGNTDRHDNQHSNKNQSRVKCNIVNNLPCKLCNAQHPLYKCGRFLQLSSYQRRGVVSSNKLCFNCLNEGHHSGVCPMEKKCKTCNRAHNTLLHFERTGAPKPNPSSSGNAQDLSRQNHNHNQLHNQPISVRTQVPSTNSPTVGPQMAQAMKVSVTYQTDMMSGQVGTSADPKYLNSDMSLTSNKSNQQVVRGDTNVSGRPSAVKTNDDEPNNGLPMQSCKASGAVMCVLPTAQVQICNPFTGINLKGNMLLDSGSQVSFVTESMVQTLRIPRTKSQLTVVGLANAGSVNTRGMVTVRLVSLHDQSEVTITAFVLKTISTDLPSEYINVDKFSRLRSIQLADRDFNRPKRIDLLLGADYFFDILKPEMINNMGEFPTLQNTLFGWVVAGKFSSSKGQAKSLCVSTMDSTPLDQTITKFWEIEEVPSLQATNTVEEEFAENHFKNHHFVNARGKFVVSLPFIPESSQLGDSLRSAASRFFSLERRLQADSNLYRQYRDFINEYLRLGHRDQVPDDELKINEQNCYYLPHHAVIKVDNSTTKCRVVFDGSNKTTSGVALNQTLAVGPTIQRDLQSILINFRWYKYGLCGDIEKMYRQIEVQTADQNYQRILWREKPDDQIKHYKLKTVTYGTSSAPFLATRCLNQIGLDCASSDPVASKAILNDFYVDDFISGGHTVNEVIDLHRGVSSLLYARRFPIRKWISNSSEILASIDEQKLATSIVDLNNGQNSVKILGLHWQVDDDYFTFRVNIKEKTVCTKRNILSEAAQIFDPMGFLSPSIVAVRIIFQELWLKKYNWDELLPHDMATRWFNLRNKFILFQDMQIPRWIGSGPNANVELIGFCDSSQLAYAAVLYVRTVDDGGHVHVNLLYSKTKVAPIKQLSIPRLELCGAHLLAKIYNFVRSMDCFKLAKVVAYTDSSVVLSWLSSHPNKWKPYVGNRTTQILDIIPSSSWRHISTKYNPADCASRGITPDSLKNHKLWWHGPDWLVKNSNEWAISSFTVDNKVVQSEGKKSEPSSFHTMVANDTLDQLFLKYSSLSKIIRIIAYCKRFKKSHSTRYLTAQELDDALRVCIKWSQQTEFHEDINRLKHHQAIPKRSNLYVLNPFLDDDGFVRILGRLANSACAYNTRHPYIIPKQHIFGKLIIKQFHLKYLHAGQSLLHNIIRQFYWIINGKRQIKGEILNCVVCTRYRATPSTQLMADLPTERVIAGRPFAHTGIDYAGPFMIRWNKGRKASSNRAYLSVFVCLTTRAVHLELVSDLTSDAFIACLRRFIGRRGVPTQIQSDNGTNFIGAQRKLDSLHKAAFTNEEKVHHFLSSHSIRWHMIPPAAPHFGGIWESTVKSAKFHIKRVIGDHLLTFEELATLLIQIEAQLNSGPLIPVCNNDPDSLDVLTPGHFLIGSPIVSFSEPSLLDKKLNARERWNLITKLQQSFWQRWKRDYLHNLQQRKKWRTVSANIKIGDVVLLKEDNLPPGVWPLARVSAVHPGKDGLVRVATIKTARSILKRPVTKLILLPIS